MILLFILYNIFLPYGNVLAGPLPPSYVTYEIPFYPREVDPSRFTRRSEWNIIWSCLATLFACSWVAIHPNIPPPSDGSRRILGRRLMMMGYMLIAPEIVIMWAVRQWYAAYDIAERNKNRRWTTTHGFFTSMGGFMLYEDGVMTKTLEIKTLEQLASDGKIGWPIISEKEIQDRSKGDPFSKGFAILQTTWFVTQCIARGVAGLPLTELELATLAFSVLNGILYTLWWNKPLGVIYPVPAHLRHLISSDSTQACSKREAGTQTTDSVPRETLDHNIYEPLFSDSTHVSLAFKFSNKAATEEMDLIPLQSPSSAPSHLLSALTCFHAYFCIKLNEKGFFATIYHILIFKPFSITSSPVFDMMKCTTMDDSHPLSVPTFYAPNSPGQENAGVIAMYIGIIFGGIHCTAWSFTFQSIIEAYVWRISAVSVTVIPVVVFSSVRVLKTLSAHSCTGKYRLTIFTWMMRSCMVVYGVSRAALLVLPLVALRSILPESLLDIKWSVFIPHV